MNALMMCKVSDGMHMVHVIDRHMMFCGASGFLSVTTLSIWPQYFPQSKTTARSHAS